MMEVCLILAAKHVAILGLLIVHRRLVEAYRDAQWPSQSRAAVALPG
jgi:hypothetical protein